jgi:hypothetical protein
MLLVKRIFRGQAVDAEKARNLVEKSVRTSTRLVIFWSLLFLYGVKETLQGKFSSAAQSLRAFSCCFS